MRRRLMRHLTSQADWATGQLRRCRQQCQLTVQQTICIFLYFPLATMLPCTMPAHPGCRLSLPFPSSLACQRSYRSCFTAAYAAQQTLISSAEPMPVAEGCPSEDLTSLSTRRQLLLASVATLSLACCGLSRAEEPLDSTIYQLRTNALQAYSRRDFADAVANLNKLIELAPRDPKWLEMRAQALVDAKNFPAALQDFDRAIVLTQENLIDRARLYSGRGLAYEGISNWVEALKDYTEALRLAEAGGESSDPYVLNSMGNCHASLGEWAAARSDYLASAAVFQGAAGFHGPRGSNTPRLDGAVFAASNAALMLAQLGDEEGAIREMQTVARRAPGSADMRAALAALYWSQGKEAEAEQEWNFACDKITVGCKKYQDEDWLFRIRRWPPVMVDRMKSFLALSSAGTTPAAGR